MTSSSLFASEFFGGTIIVSGKIHRYFVKTVLLSKGLTTTQYTARSVPDDESIDAPMSPQRGSEGKLLGQTISCCFLE